MKKLTLLIRYSALIVFAVLVAIPYSVNANQSTNQKGITVAPAVVSIVLEVNDTQNTAKVGVTNNTQNRVTLTAQVKGVDESNGVLAPSKKLDNNLQDIITIDKSEFSLDAGESTEITISVKNSTALNPGGTYTSLVVGQVQESTGNVNVRSAVAAGIFITKQQGAARVLKLNSFDINRILLNEPSSVTLGFKNEGNVLIVPRGVVSTIDNNNLYQKGVINKESLTVYPGKEVKLEVPLLNVKSAIKPSHQNIIVQYRFDGSDDIKSVTKTIWYIPIYIYILVLVIFLLCLIVFILLNKRKNNKRIKYSAQSPAVVKNEKKIKINDNTDGEKITVRRG